MTLWKFAIGLGVVVILYEIAAPFLGPGMP